MPLSTRIIRDGEPLSLRWGDFHVASMVYAVSIDSGIGPFENIPALKEQAEVLMKEQGSIGITGKDAFALTMYHIIAATPLNDSDYTMANVDLVFHDNMDGEEFEIKRGDVLMAWR